MRLLNSKKGQIDQLQPVIIVLIAVGIILAIGLLIQAQTKDVIKSQISTSFNTTNESVAVTTGQFTALANSNGLDLSCLEVMNNSGGTAITLPATNYTCVTGKGINVSTSAGTSSVNVTYTWKLPDIAYNATGKVQNATQDIPGWIPIIVITIIGSLIIGLVALFRR